MYDRADSLWLALEAHPPSPQVGHCQHSPFNKKELHSHFHLHSVISSAYCSLVLMSYCQMWLSYYMEKKSSYRRGHLDYLGVSNIHFVTPWGIPKDNTSAKKLQCNQLSSEKKRKCSSQTLSVQNPEAYGEKSHILKCTIFNKKKAFLVCLLTCILVLI